MSTYDDASLILYPSGYKASKLYSLKPTNGTGDLDVVRATTATRVNSDGLIEEVAINVPRIDYTGGGCGKLLLEPQRTNLVTYSEQFDNVAWVGSGKTITANNAISPDGTQNADKVEITSFSANAPTITQLSVVVTQNTDYTFSFYAKSDDLSELNLAVYNLNAATFILINQAKAITSDWSRVTLNFTTPSGCTSIRPFIIYGATSLGSFDLWGAQIEQGSYPTSYIPTLAAAVTRNADVVSKTGISSLIGQTQGTLFIETDLSVLSGIMLLFSVHDASANKRIEIFTNGTSLSGFIGGSVNITIGTTTISTGTHKIALAYKSTESAFYVDGVQIGTSSTAFTIAALTTLTYAQYTGLLIPTEAVKQTLLFPTRLTNSELETLTTL